MVIFRSKRSGSALGFRLGLRSSKLECFYLSFAVWYFEWRIKRRWTATESESFWAAGLEEERDGGEDGEEGARQDEIDDVIERFTSQTESERNARVRRLAAFVPRRRLARQQICARHGTHALMTWIHTLITHCHLAVTHAFALWTQVIRIRWLTCRCTRMTSFSITVEINVVSWATFMADVLM